MAEGGGGGATITSTAGSAEIDQRACNRRTESKRAAAGHCELVHGWYADETEQSSLLDNVPSPTACYALHRFSMRLRISRSAACRFAFAPLSLGAFVLSLHPWAAGAQPLAGFNSSAPVNYEADRIELQDKQKRVILSGNVAVSQGDLKLRGARMTVAYTDAGGVKIQRVDAAGGVVASRGNETARGDVAIYDFNRRIITMVGNVALQRGNDTMRGGRLVINLASGLASVEGRGSGDAGGRVSGSFSVPKSD